jgi:transcription elongation factor Elf1
LADHSRLMDATQSHFYVACPSCGQKFVVLGISVQQREVLACNVCNGYFRLRIDGNRVEPEMVRPATGGVHGPAEGPQRH